MSTRHWLVTSTTYATWLPGDARGFVSRVRDTRWDDEETPHRVVHRIYGTEYDRDIPGLQRASTEVLRGEPIWLTQEQAIVVLQQFQFTATYRQWNIHAAAVMANHFHIVVTTPESVLDSALLRDFKSYTSRALNLKWPKPTSGRWWTQSGSCRMLPDDQALHNATGYVLSQYNPLAVFEPDSSR